MNDLSRHLLAAAREGLSPDAAVAARVRARVGAAVGAPVVAATIVPAKAAGVPLAIKIALAIGVLAIGTGTAVVLSSAAPAPAAPTVALATSETPAPAAVTHTRSEHPAPAATVTPPTHARVEVMSLARETELVDLAMHALRAGNAADAVKATDTYERESRGHGQLAEEAAALAIEARCKLGADVTVRRARFDHLWPSSAQRRQIADACD